jgi:hypothetical protein
MPDRRAAQPRKPMRVLIVVGGLLLAVNIVIIAGVSQRTKPATSALPDAIEELIPNPGSLVSPQSTFGVNLRNDTTGALQFDRAEIPDDQLNVQPTEGILTFAPAPEKDLTKLPPGEHTITVVYWPRASTREADANTYTWRFKVGA